MNQAEDETALNPDVLHEKTIYVGATEAAEIAGIGHSNTDKILERLSVLGANRFLCER